MKSSVIAGLARAICDPALCDPSGTAHLPSIGIGSVETGAPFFFRAIVRIADQGAEFCTDFTARQARARAIQVIN